MEVKAVEGGLDSLESLLHILGLATIPVGFRLLQQARQLVAFLLGLLDVGLDLLHLAVRKLALAADRLGSGGGGLRGRRFRGLRLGISRFDASLAGIGGCPHAPGASGNASSEDLAFMLEASGVATGIDVPALLALRAEVTQWLAGEPTHGALWRAGLPKTYRAAHGSPAAGSTD